MQSLDMYRFHMRIVEFYEISKPRCRLGPDRDFSNFIKTNPFRPQCYGRTPGGGNFNRQVTGGAILMCEVMP